jgi:hypothetical protein
MHLKQTVPDGWPIIEETPYIRTTKKPEPTSPEAVEALNKDILEASSAWEEEKRENRRWQTALRLLAASYDPNRQADFYIRRAIQTADDFLDALEGIYPKVEEEKTKEEKLKAPLFELVMPTAEERMFRERDDSQEFTQEIIAFATQPMEADVLKAKADNKHFFFDVQKRALIFRGPRFVLDEFKAKSR